MFKKVFQKNNKKGFTILELLVVVAIIGLLSAVVLAALNSSRSKGRDAKRIEEIRQVINALELSYNTTGKYPSRAQFENPIKAQNPLSPYLWPIPKDPKTNLFYNYTGLRAGVQSSTPCTGYHIGVSLENNHKLLQADSDSRTDGTNAFRCLRRADDSGNTGNNNQANAGFNGTDTPTGNNKYKYDIRR
jgi:prepilin-type N-terminal cleavage/methylation domain-containing protein